MLEFFNRKRNEKEKENRISRIIDFRSGIELSQL